MNNKDLPTSGTDCCPHCSSCRTFFNYTAQFYKELGTAFKKFYCDRSYKKCARFFLTEKLGSETIPLDVFPNQEMRAHSLVKERQKSYS